MPESLKDRCNRFFDKPVFNKFAGLEGALLAGAKMTLLELLHQL